MTAATPLYRMLMLEIERRRQALGFPMEKFSEYAGLPDRYFSKALHADMPSGRVAQWSTLQVMIDALFPDGFDLELRARAGNGMSHDTLKARLLQLKACHDPRTQRELMATIGSIGGKNSRKNLTPYQRTVLARKAGKQGAKARWSKRG